MRRTAAEVAAYIRAMLNGTVFDENVGFDYDEFSSVTIADPQLDSLVSRACRAFEKSSPDRVALEALLAEAEALARRA